MRCIFCLEERPESTEHVFPLAIGGALETSRVCVDCNSFLGSKIDTGLTQFGPIMWKRGELGIAGNSRIPPSPFNMLEGVATLTNYPERRVRVKYNGASNKLDMKSIHHRREVELADGTKAVQIVVDETDKSDIPKIIQRERKRHGVRPLTDRELEDYLRTLEVQAIENPKFSFNLTVNFSFLRHALIKIIYELAFIWLGEDYLGDPYASLLRQAIISATHNSTDGIIGHAGLIPEQSAFAFWEPHPTHHLAYAAHVEGKIVIAVRIFDMLEAVFPVTDQPQKYLNNSQPQHGLFFLAMDSLSGFMHQSLFLEEIRRLDTMVRIYLRNLPFPDPLLSDIGTPSLNSSAGFTCLGLPWQWGWSWLASSL